MDNTYTNSIIMHLQDQLDTSLLKQQPIKKNNPLMPKQSNILNKDTYQYLDHT